MDSLRIVWVDEEWERFDRLREMLYAVLYGPYGVDPQSDWYHDEPGETAVALAGGRIVGSARLLGEAGEEMRQLRQVAVEPALQGQGIGRALVDAAEHRAAAEGSRHLWLNARASAYQFYASLGFSFEGEPFVSELTRLPHRRMSKELRPVC